jgi:hypothetical protein
MHTSLTPTPLLRCVVCHAPFDFVAGEAALVCATSPTATTSSTLASV